MKNQRPERVSLAITVLYSTIGIGILNSIIFYDKINLYASEQSGAKLSDAFHIYILAFTLGFLGFFTWLIGRRKNWARVIFLVSSIAGIFGVVNNLVSAPGYVRVSAIIGTLTALAQYYAIFLLFTGESKEWFKGAHGQNIVKPLPSNVAPIKAVLPTANVSDLSKLHDLLKSGAITQAEYEQEKRKILGNAA